MKKMEDSSFEEYQEEEIDLEIDSDQEIFYDDDEEELEENEEDRDFIVQDNLTEEDIHLLSRVIDMEHERKDIEDFMEKEHEFKRIKLDIGDREDREEK